MQGAELYASRSAIYFTVRVLTPTAMNMNSYVNFKFFHPFSRCNPSILDKVRKWKESLRDAKQALFLQVYTVLLPSLMLPYVLTCAQPDHVRASELAQAAQAHLDSVAKKDYYEVLGSSSPRAIISLSGAITNYC